MYAITNLLSLSVKSNVRRAALHYNSKSKKRSKKTSVNPGISYRSQMLYENEFVSNEDVELDHESDFMNVASSHKQHLNEFKALREREKYNIVKQKYFKEKSPNFLTWSDKLQMKHLHSSDPDEWTIEKLSEGFPALPGVILKIVKSNWTKKNDLKIRRHDEAVAANWKSFKENKLDDLPPDLSDHLNKFSNRELNYQSVHIPRQLVSTNKMIQPNLKTNNEFLEIISSYESLKNTGKEPVIEETLASDQPQQDTYLLSSFEKFKDKKDTTLSQWVNKLEKSLSKGKSCNEEDTLIIQEMKKTDLSQNEEKVDELDIPVKKYNTSELQTNSGKSNYEFLNYPEKITIPKNKQKRGCTYKLNDCYYDDDGEFLYRVPGMCN